MTRSFIDRWSPGPALRRFTGLGGFTARHEDPLEEPTLIICLPLAEHTFGAQTNNYFECILIGLCHRPTHNPEVSLYSKSQGGEKMQKINLILLEQTKPKLALCFPQHRSHLRKGGLGTKLQEAWWKACSAAHQPHQFLPWSNKTISGNNIPSVVARNK